MSKVMKRYIQYPYASSNPKSQTPPSVCVPLPSQPCSTARCAAIDRTSPSPIPWVKAATKPSHHPPNPPYPNQPSAIPPAWSSSSGPPPGALSLAGPSPCQCLLSAHNPGCSTPQPPGRRIARVRLVCVVTCSWQGGCVCAGCGSGGGDWLSGWCC